jgi:uncharacterized protein with GYD domain
MPYFMHQWVYKDAQIKKMIKVDEDQDRAEIVQIATAAFGGELLQFFLCFGEYDGVSISKFPDNETALACIMSILAEGRLHSVRTTVLCTPQEAKSAMQKAHEFARDKGS